MDKMMTILTNEKLTILRKMVNPKLRKVCEREIITMKPNQCKRKLGFFAKFNNY